MKWQLTKTQDQETTIAGDDSFEETVYKSVLLSKLQDLLAYSLVLA